MGKISKLFQSKEYVLLILKNNNRAQAVGLLCTPSKKQLESLSEISYNLLNNISFPTKRRLTLKNKKLLRFLSDKSKSFSSKVKLLRENATHFLKILMNYSSLILKNIKK